MSAFRHERDLVRLETRATSTSFTAMLVSLGQTAPAILSTDNENVCFSDMY
jgi:hypothetical protein